MAELSKEELKKKFSNGTLIKEQHFVDLIDSLAHKSTDQTGLGTYEGLRLIPSEKRYISFFKNTVNQQKDSPSFTFEWQEDKTGVSEGLALLAADGKGRGKEVISFKSEQDRTGTLRSKVGINTSVPFYDLDVNGSIGMKSRIGRYSDPAIDPKKILADGRWHKVLTNLKGISAFEVLAVASSISGQQAMYYAILLNASGMTKKISPQQRSHTSWLDRLQMRWVKESNGVYGLEVRTARDFKNSTIIYFRITKLWN